MLSQSQEHKAQKDYQNNVPIGILKGSHMYQKDISTHLYLVHRRMDDETRSFGDTIRPGNIIHPAGHYVSGQIQRDISF